MIVSVYGILGIKYTESIKQIRHTASEPLPCGPATTYLKNLTVHVYVYINIYVQTFGPFW